MHCKKTLNFCGSKIFITPSHATILDLTGFPVWNIIFSQPGYSHPGLVSAGMRGADSVGRTHNPAPVNPFSLPQYMVGGVA